MKEYEAKTVDEALKKAGLELNVPVESIKYEVISEVKGLFKKYAKIGVYETSDTGEFGVKYLSELLQAMGLTADIAVSEKDGITHLDMTSEADANRIIGRGGETLRAMNELVRGALYNKFGEHCRVLLNINGYKDQKYEKLIAMSKRIASSVARTRITAELNPMTSDERRAIHNALADFPHIKTLSIGAGKDRHVTIQYVNSNDEMPSKDPISVPKEDISPVNDDMDKVFEEKEKEVASSSETEQTPTSEETADKE